MTVEDIDVETTIKTAKQFQKKLLEQFEFVIKNNNNNDRDDIYRLVDNYCGEALQYINKLY